MSSYQDMPIAKAINAGLQRAMGQDEKVLVFGEDVAKLGGVFRVTEGLLDEFGEKRIFNSPIAESGIVGTAIGLAMRGYRPVAEIQFDGFVFPAPTAPKAFCRCRWSFAFRSAAVSAQLSITRKAQRLTSHTPLGFAW